MSKSKPASQSPRPSLVLASSPTLLVDDRFSITPSTAATVPFWEIINYTLVPHARTIDDLTSQLETLAITLSCTAGTDYAFLRETFTSHFGPKAPYFFAHTWPPLVTLALRLKEFYPYHNIPALSTTVPGASTLFFSEEKIACLVLHQFLCTFPRASWMTVGEGVDCSPDFSIWYGSEPRCPGAVSAYLTGLFTYFERVAERIGTESSRRISYSLYSRDIVPPPDYDSLVARALQGSSTAAFSPEESAVPFFRLTRLGEAHTQPSGLSSTGGEKATLISANWHIGFGRSATQEEAQVGCCPEACPAVLFTPPLSATDILVVKDVRPAITIAGYGRDARLDAILPVPTTPNSGSEGLATLLFLDALELDGYDTSSSSSPIPDLLPDNIDRELTKAYTAFAAFWHYHSSPSAPASSTQPGGQKAGIRYPVVRTGLWGCGSFGGNAEIKTIIQLCAAGMARVRLDFVVTDTHSPRARDVGAEGGDGERDFETQLLAFAKQAWDQKWKTGDVLAILKELKPESGEARGAFKYVMEGMKARMEEQVQKQLSRQQSNTESIRREEEGDRGGDLNYIPAGMPMPAARGRRRSSIRELFGRRKGSVG
jgi:poly(ADP-ribose) glycohydrolase